MPGSVSHDLTTNAIPYPPSPEMLVAMAQEVAHANEYPDARSAELSATLAARLGVPADRLLVGPGSAALCQLLLMTVAGPGDQIVYPWPSFEDYPAMIGHAGAMGVAVPLREHGIDLDAMAAAITTRTRAVLLCNPNNPTGTALDGPRLAAFLAAVPAHVLVVVDEAYRDFVTDPGFQDAWSLASPAGGLCVLRTFSKAYGLAGLRVGYLVGPRALTARLRTMMPLFSVGSPGQAAALAALTDEFTHAVEKRCGEIAAERDRLATMLRAQGWQLPRSQGNFVWLPVRNRSEELAAFFLRRNVLVRVYPGEGVRITVTDSQIVNLVARIAAAYLLA
ncbi:aminotransferase class I/II-fold pyridoxal phosphate-dependent enzyme [Amycolatopsis sp. cg5]|uniref:aminotransferase class I/II-fold pyridoxal phosphate-dependent enzyme n=1 Tax=Amycolatopsis sp. cg5 TaxID=3238802 RepID=UPI0035231E47